MNKDQLLHLHGLFAQIREETAERHDIQTPNYNETDAGPMSLHMSKDKHKVAVFELAADLAEQTQQVEEIQKPTLET
jgi:hypothetical protein